MSKNETKITGVDRLLFFHDAVYAISITLLALEIKLPESVDLSSNTSVWHSLGVSLPYVFAYALSFLVIGSLWLGHHRKYSGLVSYNSRFIWLNLLSLLFVAFMPFPTSLLSSSSTVAASILYASTLAIIGILSAITWMYARNHKFVAEINKSFFNGELRRPIAISLVFLGSICLAPLGSDIVRISWLLLVPILLAIRD